MDESLLLLEKIVSLFVGLTKILGVSDLQNKFTFSFCQARRIYVLSCPCSANTESVNGGQDPGHVHNFNNLSRNIKKAVLNIAVWLTLCSLHCLIKICVSMSSSGEKG